MGPELVMANLGFLVDNNKFNNLPYLRTCSYSPEAPYHQGDVEVYHQIRFKPRHWLERSECRTQGSETEQGHFAVR
jgi:hypothetical protein